MLFLILIAVALFAALSYAVTQSSRSGSGDANSEKSLVSGAEVTQYPAGVRTAIVRMVISNNISVDQLYFDDPSTFTAEFPNGAGTPSRPDHYQRPEARRLSIRPAAAPHTSPRPSEVMESQHAWHSGISTRCSKCRILVLRRRRAATIRAGNDLIAWLPERQTEHLPENR